MTRRYPPRKQAEVLGHIVWIGPKTARKSLSRKQAEVLEHIVKSGPRTEYSISKELHLSTGTLHYTLEELEKKQLLRVEFKGKARTGLTIKEYHLTVRGVAVTLGLTSTREEVDAAAERWGSLIPLVLGKWDYLKEKAGEGKVHSRLDITTKAFLSPELANFYSVWSFANLTSVFPSPSDEILFTCLFYDLNIIVREFPGWLGAIEDDPDIREFILKILPCYKDPHEDWIKTCGEMEKRLSVSTPSLSVSSPRAER